MATTRLIGIIFLMLLSSFATQKKDKNHLEKDGLKGKVQSVKEVSYKPSSYGYSVTKGEKYRMFGNNYDTYIEFNKQGNYIQVNYYESSGDFIGKYTYLYDSKHNNTQVNWYGPDNGLIQEHIYKYDKKGNAIEYKMIYPNGEGLYFTDIIKYDKEGNKIEEVRYHPKDNTVINQKVFSYNSKNYKIEDRVNGSVESTYQYETNSKKIITEKRTYNESGNLISKINYNSKGKTLEENTYKKVLENGGSLSNPNYITLNDFKLTYQYDSKGNTIETIQIDKLQVDKVLRKLTTKYTYDKTGNWITKIYYVNDKPKSIIEREIIYN